MVYLPGPCTSGCSQLKIKNVVSAIRRYDTARYKLSVKKSQLFCPLTTWQCVLLQYMAEDYITSALTSYGLDQHQDYVLC